MVKLGCYLNGSQVTEFLEVSEGKTFGEIIEALEATSARLGSGEPLNSNLEVYSTFIVLTYKQAISEKEFEERVKCLDKSYESK